MLRPRVLGLALRCELRTSSLSRPPTGKRFHPLRSFHSRGYSNDTRNRHRIPEGQLSESNEPNTRSWRYYAIPAALLLVAGAGTFIHYNDEKRAIPKDSNQNTLPERSNKNRPAIGGPFKLYDTENSLVTETNLKGNWTLMYFGYTSCPDIGPEEMQKMTEAINILDSNYKFRITPVFVTIDPQRDLPAQLRTYLEEFDPRIVGLTGPIAAVRQIAQEYRVFFKKVDEIGQDYLVECSHNMYLLDPNLETVRCFGVEYDALQLADAIIMEVKKASKRTDLVT